MHIPPRHLLAGVAVAMVATVAVVISVSSTAAATPAPPARIIVELSSSPGIRGAAADQVRGNTPAARAGVAASRSLVSARQDTFLTTAKSAGIHASRTRKLNLLLDAVAMTVPADEVATIRTMAGVTAVYPDTKFQVQADADVTLIGAPQVWAGNDSSGVAARGDGVTVAVIDTGVDYTNPDLGGGFGPGFKIVGGYDFVNGDADPMDDEGHGTHVAGIIAARAASPDGITGVAPDASIMAYKVMDQFGSGYTSDIVAGIEAATDPANPHRADVINLSLGSPGDGTDPVGLAATAATQAGVVVVAAAGNDGPGAGTVGSPADAPGVIAVGASISGTTMPTATIGHELLQTYRGADSANPPSKPEIGRLVDAGFGSPEEWDALGDLTGKVALVQFPIPRTDGDIGSWDIDMAREAESRGAIAMIGGQAGGGGISAVPQAGVVQVTATAPRVAASGGDLRMDSLVVLGVDALQYADLQQWAASGDTSVTISGLDATDQIASFSSRGPTGDFGLKPDLVAPGFQIRSTVPTWLSPTGQYRMSGTSMAAPHTAGAAALLRQLHPGESPADVESALVGTAKHLSGIGVTTQGGGRLDVAAAAAATVTAAPASLSFGLADMSATTIRTTGSVALTNHSAHALTTHLSTTGGASVVPRTVTIAAGRTATVTVTISMPRPRAFTDIAGSVTATPNHGPSIGIPYLFAVRPLSVQVSPDPSDGRSTLYVQSDTALATAPVATMTSPAGRVTHLTLATDYATGFHADMVAPLPGVYTVTVAGRTIGGQHLIGTNTFEVTPIDAKTGTWRPVGPLDTGGSVTLSPTAPHQAVVVEADKPGPWLTTDSGRTWSQLNRLPVTSTIGANTVIVDARTSATWWYAINDAGDGRGKILRTVDRGRTWKTVAAFPSGIEGFTANASTTSLAVLTYAGLEISNDKGNTWSAYATDTIGSANYLTFGGSSLYLATGDGIWRVPDADSATPGDATEVYDAPNFVASIVADGDTVAAQVYGVGVVGTTDSGAHWSTLLDLPWSGTDLQASNGDLFLATYDGSGYISHDHGTTWTTIPQPSSDAAVLDYDRWADGTITVTDTAGVYRGAADGTGYTRIGVQGLTVHDLAISGNALIAGTDSGTYRTAIPAASTEWGAADGEGYVGVTVSQIATAPSNHRIVWRVRKDAFGDFLVDESTDAGVDWQQVGSWTEVPTALLVDPVNSAHVWVAFESLYGNGLYTTSDGGTTWKALYHDDAFTALAADPTKRGRIWLSSEAGLYRSDDGGVTKTLVSAGPVSAISFNGSHMVVGGLGIRVSSNGGRSFATATSGRLGMDVVDFANVGSTIYAATDAYSMDGIAVGGRGVLRSTDGGATWINVSHGLSDLDATALAVSADGAWLFVGTADGGVQRLQLK